MNEEEIFKMLLTEKIEKFPLLNEIFAIRNNKFKINDYTIYVTGCISLDVINRAIEKVNLINKLQKENEKLKKQSEISAKTHIKNDDLKDKVIDKMAKTIAGLQLYDFGRKEYFTLEDEGEVREYFYKKAEEENES